MLHSRLLRYLDEVARAGSIRKASERLNVSPTAVNRRILLLEEELGVELFQRLPRGMRLTSAGEILIEHVRQTLKAYRATASRIDDLKNLGGGEVNIATMNGLAGGLVGRLVSDYCEHYPRVRVNCSTLFINDIVEAVGEGAADIGLGYNLPKVPHLNELARYEAPLGAAVTPDHPLARRAVVRPSDCLGHPLILARETMVMHHRVREWFLEAGLDIQPRHLSNSIEFMKQLALSSRMVAFLGRFDIAEELERGTLVHRPFADDKLGRNTLALVTHRRQALTNTAAVGLIEVIKERLDHLDALTR
ncbi:LysR family transcriptional regulator [Alloalcanivorax gelatiniphagus]|nr:LysR substrate-binding domain-containing protein [Alloalcanivorax gelatiniphagus]